MRFSVIIFCLSLTLCLADATIYNLDYSSPDFGERIGKKANPRKNTNKPKSRDDNDKLDKATEKELLHEEKAQKRESKEKQDLSIYDSEKSGVIVGVETSFISLSFGGIEASAIGGGVKLGYQNYSRGFLGSRVYASYRYFDAHVLMLNADAIFDLPFNFNDPKHAIGLILGVGLGTAISGSNYLFTYGSNIGLALTVYKRHRVEFIAQILLFQYIIPVANYNIGYTINF